MNYSIFKLFNAIISELEAKFNTQNNKFFDLNNIDIGKLDNNINNISYQDKETMIKDLDNMMNNMTSMFNKIQYSKNNLNIST